MLLPAQFWGPHGSPPWQGGVERALMSTTADKAVALHYANGKGTVVEIDVGRIQIGGEVAFLSMVSPSISSLTPLQPQHPAPFAQPPGLPCNPLPHHPCYCLPPVSWAGAGWGRLG